jgi:hypothetical protein
MILSPLDIETKKKRDFFDRRGLFIQTSTPPHDEAAALGEKLHKILSK